MRKKKNNAIAKQANKTDQTKQLYKKEDIHTVLVKAAVHMPQQISGEQNTAAQSTKPCRAKAQSDRHSSLKIYLRSAYFTLLFCLLAAFAATLFLLPQTGAPKTADGDFQIPIDASGQTRISNQKLTSYLFLRSEYDQRLIKAVIILADASNAEFIVCTVPENTNLGEKSLREIYTIDGPSVAKEALNRFLGINVARYFDFQSQQLYQLTKNYGNITYKLDEGISYYDPKTANSFLAAAGYNKLNGNDCAKLIEYFIMQDATNGRSDDTCSQLVKCFFQYNIHGLVPDRERFIRLLNNAKTDVTAFDYEDCKASIAQFCAADITYHVIACKGSGNVSADIFFLAPDTMQQLKEKFA